jgi:ubiquinone/menaquinone biosynthesis C-methylase UbiE
MKNVFVDKYCEFPAAVRKPMWHIWHRLLVKFDHNKDVNFMNYGYQGLNGKAPIHLEKEDESNRYCIQLYDHVAEKSDLKNKDVAEIGSGRGGGASYLTRYYKPKSYTGLDISVPVIDFCNKYYQIPELSFIKGVAEKQPFRDNSFDVLINIESARCYSSLITFFKEVHRVLRPGGEFLFADLMYKGEVEGVKDKLRECGFVIIHQQEITKNVVKALEKDTGRRDSLIDELIPGFMKRAFEAFAATKGSLRYESFASGKIEYWSFVLRHLEAKPVQVTSS